MACSFADDAYLIAAFPAVVTTSPGSWTIRIVSAAAGVYSATVQGVVFAVTATNADTVETIRKALLNKLSLSLVVAVSPAGVDSIALGQIGAGAVTVAVSGPVNDPPRILLTQTSGGDNAAQRAFWLERARCKVPACHFFGCCEADFTLYHAAWAAHLILLALSAGAGGTSALDFESMRLGPAALTRGLITTASSGASDLARTPAGQIILQLRRQYLPGLVCG